jgi:hypothetical protein
MPILISSSRKPTLLVQDFLSQEHIAEHNTRNRYHFVSASGSCSITYHFVDGGFDIEKWIGNLYNTNTDILWLA